MARPQTENRIGKSILLLFIAGCLGVALMSVFSTQFGSRKPEELRTSDFLRSLEEGRIATASWQGTEVSGKLEPAEVGASYIAIVPAPDSEGGALILSELKASDASWTIEKPPASSAILGVLSVIAFPLMIIALIYFLVLRPAQMRR